MNIIKGLILKDLLQLKSYLRTIIFYLFFFSIAIFGYAAEDKTINTNLLVLLTLLFGMFAISSFSYDATSKTDRYVLTLPTTKKEVVASKYLLTAISTLIGTFASLIINLIVSFWITRCLPNFYELITVALSGAFGIAFAHAVQLPCIYKFGIEKGRIVATLITLIIASSIANILIFNITENTINENIEKLLPFVFLISIFIFYYISYKISCLIYEKKEV